MMESKNTLGKNNFYIPLLNALKHSTNLTNIRKELGISKQSLNYYLRILKRDGIINQKGKGWYEVNGVKLLTKYENHLSKDSIRGHAYIWKINFTQKIQDWDKRLEILKKNNINFVLVGALKTTPRIKALGRNVWLCNDHLRIFDKKKSSYYGKNAIESRKYAFQELLLIVGVLEKKLGVSLRPYDFEWKKEHYALIKNDLAIDQNKKGIIWRINDESGEWLLIDDSLEEGGELENIGKDAFKTNIPMQKWWNDNKKHNFEVTSSFVLESLGGLIQNQQMNADNIIKHQKVLDEMLITLKSIRDALEKK